MRSSQPQPAGVSTTRQENLTLLVCCTSLFMSTLDNTVLNVALPSIQRGFHASLPALQWAADAYVLGRACTLFLAGSISDRYGRLRYFNVGQIVFVAGSIACALSPNINALIYFRVFQAFGSALMTPASLAIIANTFTERVRRARAIGVWNATTGISVAAGPLVGGALVVAFGWRSVFWINVPIGILALIGSRLYLQESKASAVRRFDKAGQFAIGLTLLSLTYGFITVSGSGWFAPVVLVAFAVAIVSAIGFVSIERRIRSPLLEFSDFKNRALSGAVILAIISFMVSGGFIFLNTLYLQEGRGFSPLAAGLSVLPLAAFTVVLAPLSGKMTGTRGPLLPTLLATSFAVASMILMTITIGPTTSIVLLLCGYALLGIGNGFLNTPITDAAVAGMPPERAGVASATTATARQVGTSLGISLIGSIAFSAAKMKDQLPAHSGSTFPTATLVRFAHGLSFGYAAGALFSVIAVGVAIWAFRKPGSRMLYSKIERTRKTNIE
ncbi:MAG TPA: MFS transporter [Acidimicrobiales bacterium]|nr:MFS transporter [Acidimicrobiales bacterium]